MTQEQLDKLYIIGEKIKEICPEMWGSIRFNLEPGRKLVKINIEESKILTDPNK